MMKKILLLLVCSLMLGSAAFAQEMPLTESYFVNKYALSPSYAGNNSQSGYLFASYLQYWMGVSDAPQTLRLSYNTGFKGRKLGLGGNIIMDKAGIFRTLYARATYSYRLKVSSSQAILFGLSAGFIKNSDNFSEFINNPIYSSDPALSNQYVSPKAKFVSDISMVYTRKDFQIGAMVSNINFGKNYSNATITNYSPELTYQFHAFYTIPFNDRWNLTALAIYRGSKNIRKQFEIGAQVKYLHKMWASMSFLGENILSFGFGLNVSKSILLNYNYNYAEGVDFNALRIHEITLGIKL